MADKKISQLPVGEINSTSIFPLVTDGITSKTTFEAMADAFGGGSQNFQETLENGNISTIPFYHEANDGISVQSGIIARAGEAFPLNGISMSYESVEPGAFVRIGFATGEGPVIVIESNFAQGGGTGATISTNYYLPHSQDGGSNQIITDKDLTLQKAIEGDGEAKSPDELNIFNFKLENDDTRFEFNGQTTSGSHQMVYGLDIYGNTITSVSPDGTGYVRVGEGNVVLATTSPNNHYAQVSFETPYANGANLLFPAKSGSGQFIFATLDDLAIDNPTTSQLTGTALNSTYPNAVNGFRVHCSSISSGGLIYEKTSTNWVQYSITTVAP